MCDPRIFIEYPGHRKEPELRSPAERQRGSVWRRNLADASGCGTKSSVIATTGRYRSSSASAVPFYREERPKAEEFGDISRHSSDRRGRSSREKSLRRREQLRLFGRAGELDPSASDDGMLPEYFCVGNNRVAYDRDLAGKRRIWCFNAMASESLPYLYKSAESAGERNEERKKAWQGSVPEEKQYKKKEACRALHLGVRQDAELQAAESPRLRRCFPRPFGRLTKFGRANAGRVYAAPQVPKYVSASPSNAQSPLWSARDECLLLTDGKRENRHLPRHSKALETTRAASSKGVNQAQLSPRNSGLQTRRVNGDIGSRSSVSVETKQADRKLGRARRRSADGMCIPNLGALEWDALEIIRSGQGRPRNLLRNRNALDYPSTALARVATCNILGCIPY